MNQSEIKGNPESNAISERRYLQIGPANKIKKFRTAAAGRGGAARALPTSRLILSGFDSNQKDCFKYIFN